MNEAGGHPSPIPVSTTVRALRVSRALDDLLPEAGGPGTVLTVHHDAINLLVGDHVVSLVEPSVGDVPNGAVLAGMAEAGRLVRPGQSVERTGGRLRMGGALVVDLDAPRWDPRIHRTAIADAPVRLAAVRRARLARVKGGRADATGDRRWVGFRPLLDERVEGLRRALLAGDVPEASAAGRALVGLGPGLTPSGDDILVGLGAVLWSVEHPARRTLGAAWAEAAGDATTALAGTFHRHAAGGDFSLRLHELCAAVLAEPVTEIPAAVDRAAAWGATSGLDLVAGVELGLEAALASFAPSPGRLAA